MNASFGDELIGHKLDKCFGCACGHSHLAGVQGHVPFLDAHGGQGIDGGQVLRQPDGGHHLGQLWRRFYV